jgi:threonyl-tRNA synthetase
MAEQTISITLNGEKKEVAADQTGVQLFSDDKNIIAVRLNGEPRDLYTELHDGDVVEPIALDSEDGVAIMRHSATHVMAQAVQEIRPDAKLGVGPVIKDGFYYDFDVETPFTPEDLKEIEKRMQRIIKSSQSFRRRVVTEEEALAEEADQPYKLELIKDKEAHLDPEAATEISGKELSFYDNVDREGNVVWKDLCRGPHLPNTRYIKAFKIERSAAAYWRGSEKNKMLKRIYATAFEKKADLDEYINMLEEAKKRDHRKLGKELGLFAMMDEGPGFPFFLPKGMVLKNKLIDYWREVHKRYGYVEISTPIMLNRSLWERSGHWDHYKNNMYTTVIDDVDFAVKPMNCPGGMLVYQTEMRSYRDLPLRMGELGLVHRHELSGALHGLFRVRCFTQDDAHIFMTWDQMKDEIKNVVRLFDEVYSTFGLKYSIELSTMPEDHIGDVKDWDFATETLKAAITELGKEYVINEGDGAFYGPKLDFHLADCLGRTWQCGTIQLDMQLPERFELEYTGADGAKHRPVMIHRVVFGSIERFIGVITEHFAGAFPTWLAPVQVKVMAMTDRTRDAVCDIAAKLEAQGIRVETDLRNEKIGFKIREAQMQKIPYMLIVGDKEVENGVVAVRARKGGDLGTMTLDAFEQKINEEVASKTLD